MTDGENTNDYYTNWNESIYTGLSYIKQNRLINPGAGSTGTQRTAAMDARLALLCSNMRAQDIIIYTVRVEVDSQGNNVLRDCATSPDHYYEVANAANLSDAFASIAGSITQLRIAH